MSKHKRGVGRKGNQLVLIAPQQPVVVVGRSASHHKPMYRVRLITGEICEIPASWIGGVDLADEAYEETRARVILASEHQKRRDEEPRNTYSELKARLQQEKRPLLAKPSNH